MNNLDLRFYDERTDKLLNICDDLIICCETLTLKNTLPLELLKMNNTEAYNYVKNCESMEGIVSKTQEILSVVYNRISKIISSVKETIDNTLHYFGKITASYKSGSNAIAALKETEFYRDSKKYMDELREDIYQDYCDQYVPNVNFLRDRFSNINQLRNIIVKYDLQKFKKMSEEDLKKFGNISDLNNDIFGSFIKSDSGNKEKNGITLNSNNEVKFLRFKKVKDNYKITTKEFEALCNNSSLIEEFSNQLVSSLSIIKNDLSSLDSTIKKGKLDLKGNKLASGVFLKATQIVADMNREIIYEINELAKGLKKNFVMIMHAYDANAQYNTYANERQSAEWRNKSTTMKIFTIITITIGFLLQQHIENIMTEKALTYSHRYE